jgi:hypothetical protein
VNEETQQRVLQLFLAGATYPQIAAAVELDSSQAVHDIVCAEMLHTGDRRGVLMDNFKAVFQERAEALFKAHWPPALRGDHKSAEICRKLLDQQARLFADPAFQTTEFKGDVVDEIAARRSTRGAGPAKGSPRAKRSS